MSGAVAAIDGPPVRSAAVRAAGPAASLPPTVHGGERALPEAAGSGSTMGISARRLDVSCVIREVRPLDLNDDGEIRGGASDVNAAGTRPSGP